jgi:hypothetical protein
VGLLDGPGLVEGSGLLAGAALFEGAGPSAGAVALTTLTLTLELDDLVHPDP